MTIRGKVAVIGAAETDIVGVIPDKSALELHAESARNALEDCGLTVADIDGIATAGPSPVNIAHYLGIQPSWLDGTMVGGGSFMLLVRHAAAAICAGMCTTVLITHGQSGRSRIGATSRVLEPSSLEGQFELPYGANGPTTLFPLGLLRYMKDFGLTHEQVASVAVTQREWAGHNPRAMMREPITIEDVLASPFIAYPLHRLECCLVTDGGGALVVTAADRLASLDLPKKPVYLLGSGESSESPLVAHMDDVTTSRAFRHSGRAAFQEAGIQHRDVNHLMIYDAFAHLPIYGLEDLGFVGRGEAGSFIVEGNTRPGGKLPLNTNGGGLSYTHTGLYGMFAIQESIRQVRGEAAAQVADVDISVAHGVGGFFWSAGTLIFGTKETI
jgi:acetyl-CoA acetyltransferase